MRDESSIPQSPSMYIRMKNKIVDWTTEGEKLDTPLTFPNGTVMATKHTKALPVFAQEGGLLYRIVRKCKWTWNQWREQEHWSYYNDSNEYVMYITAQFHHICEIKALGKTTLTLADSGDWIATLVVPPLTEEPFVQGNINGFASRVDAVRVEQAGVNAVNDNYYGGEVAVDNSQAPALTV